MTEKPTWRRKTEAERRRGERQLQAVRPLHALRIGAVGALFGGAMAAAVFVATEGFGLDALLAGVCGAIGFGAMSSTLALALDALGMLTAPKRLRMGICNQCFKFTIDGNRDTCECGGSFEDADGWTLNRCPRCGFDLRGSSSRCPECGALVIPAIPNQDAAP